MRKITSIAAALMLSACSTNYGMYKKGDDEHGQYGYVSTYLAIAAAGKLYASVVRGPNPGAKGASGNGGVVASYGTDF